MPAVDRKKRVGSSCEGRRVTSLARVAVDAKRGARQIRADSLLLVPGHSRRNQMECPETRPRLMKPFVSERTLREGPAQHNNGMHLTSGVVGRGAYMRARPVVVNRRSQVIPVLSGRCRRVSNDG
jgi:hypothetical protein